MALKSDGPFPIIEKLITRSQKNMRTSTWLSAEEYKALPLEIDRLMRERATLIEQFEAKIASDLIGMEPHQNGKGEHEQS